MITNAERERIIKLLEVAVRAETHPGMAMQHLAAVRRILAVHNCTLADALIDREALRLLQEAQEAIAEPPAVLIDPITFDG